MRVRFIVILLLFFSFYSLSVAQQNKTVYKKKEVRDSWSVGVLYSENGFGLYGTYFKDIGKTTDLFFKLSFSGVTDDREIEYYDIYGNTFVRDKENRLFKIPLSIGIQKYVFADDLEGNFRPIVNAGIAPALIVSNPYEKGFFTAIPYSKAAFAIGPFIGAGLVFQEAKNLGMAITFNYYYQPVIVNEVMSLKDKPIKNVGGIELNFSVKFFN